MTSFEDNLLVWAESNGLFEDADGLLLAVSGGADSVALTVALHRLVTCKRLNLKLVIGHVNHTLRGGASDGDESFVRRLAERLNLPFICRRVNVRDHARTNRLSIETAARNLRLEALSAMARTEGCDAVATGHHADDQAETVLHRLMRGTALRGLCGIRAMSNLNGMRLIRPLLNARQADVEAYLRANTMTWRQDTSNQSSAFTRNRIRHQLLPELQTQTPDITERLTQLAQLCRKAQGHIESTTASIQPIGQNRSEIAYDRFHFARLSPWIQAELLSRAVQALDGGLRDLTRRHYRDLMIQAQGTDSAKISWPGGMTVTVDADRVTLSKPRDNVSILPTEPVTLDIGSPIDFGPYTIHLRKIDIKGADFCEFFRRKPPMTEWLDAECIQGPITVRQRAPGDRFWPIGMGCEKKIARFLMDSKIDKVNRESVFVLADLKKTLWLAPLRLDDRAKVTKSTNKILEIHLV